MKKKIVLLVVLLCCMALMVVCMAACDDKEEQGSGNDDQGAVAASYIIQYTDNTGTYSIEVTPGAPYSMPSIPQKEGYEFAGLFDAEVGGTQYVNAQGASLSPFTDNKNLVLFPHFQAKEYIIALDYQGAAVTGAREITVSYGTRITDLPVNLSIPNKVFSGWYTEPDKKGVQIADQYGVIPIRSLVISDNFDLSDANGFIQLYAGFTGEMHTVTFYFADGMSPEEVSVEHGTPISQVVPTTRVDEQAVLVWSREPNDSDRSALFTGRVESDLVLYAQEYAPVIDFDSNGGEEVVSIVARAGSAIALPEAERANWKFAGWYTAGNASFTATAMPTESVKLKAKWLPMLIFDERGGTLVDDIAAEQGTRVTLPETEKDGYMFAGWYTEQGEKYTATAMPQTSTKLAAKYYKILNRTVVLINETDYVYYWSITERPSMDESMHQLDLSELYNAGVRDINVTVHYDSIAKQGTASSPQYTYMAWYSARSASDAYKIWSYSDKHIDGNWSTYTQKTSLTLTGSYVFICRYSSKDDYYYYFGWRDFWIEIEYPDTSALY